MAGAILRIISARCPYRRAGVSFEPNGAHSYGVALVDLDALDEAALEALLSDPHLDVSISADGLLFAPGAALPLDVEPAPPPRGTEAALTEHARLLAEQKRAEATGPEGDEQPEAVSEESSPSAPATEAAADEAAPASAPASAAASAPQDATPPAKEKPAPSKQPASGGRKK